MNKNVEFIDNNQYPKCYKCSGTGIDPTNKKVCPTCKGSKVFSEPNYIMVAKTPNGQKIAFQVDGFS